MANTDKLTEKQWEVLSAVRSGMNTREKLSVHLRIPESSCNGRVRRLIAAGKLREFSGGHGRYRLEAVE